MNEVLIKEETDGFMMIENKLLRNWVKVKGNRV